MTKLGGFIKTTIVGGLLFLIPMMVVIIICAKAFSFLGKIAIPLAARMSYLPLGGISLATLLTIIFLLIVCFVAGLFMRTNLAKKIKKYIEEQLLQYIPGYSYLQALSLENFDRHNLNWKPASIVIDDNEVICFVIDESEHFCSIYLPSSPSPSSGTVVVHRKGDILYLPLTVTETLRMLRQMGKGGASVFENPAVNRATSAK